MPLPVSRPGLLSSLLAALAFGASASAPAKAQSSPAALTATVVNDQGLPLSGAAVWVGGRSALTDRAGRATIGDIPVGVHFVRARADGYQPESVTLEFAAGAKVEFEARLAALPEVIRFTPISVEAERRAPQLVVTGFYTRRQLPGGMFLDREELARSDHLPEVALLFRNLRGFQATLYCERGWCRRYVIRSTRGTTGLRSGGCTPQIIVDGMPWDDEMLGSLAVADVEAVEAYAGPATTPPQFILNARGTSCGTVVFWTRRSHR